MVMAYLICTGDDAGCVKGCRKASQRCCIQLRLILHHRVSCGCGTSHCGWNGGSGYVDWTTARLLFAGRYIYTMYYTIEVLACSVMGTSLHTDGVLPIGNFHLKLGKRVAAGKKRTVY